MIQIFSGAFVSKYVGLVEGDKNDLVCSMALLNSLGHFWSHSDEISPCWMDFDRENGHNNIGVQCPLPSTTNAFSLNESDLVVMFRQSSDPSQASHVA